jgi:ABC-type multidrug transport system ATPase subunit
LRIEDLLDRPAGGLSTGQSRRLLLAAALLGDPEVLLLDEPTLGLDPAARIELRRILRELRSRGRTLLVSTHLLEDVRDVCDRVLFLRDGHLIGDQPVDVAPRDAAGRRLRGVRFRFLAPMGRAQLESMLHEGERLVLEPPGSVLCWVEDEDRRQQALVSAVARAGAALLSAETVGPDLDQRYLDTVGREDL